MSLVPTYQQAIIITIYCIGIFYYYPRTVYLDGDYTPSWESPLCLIWFIWFPLKWLCNKLFAKESNSVNGGYEK